MDIPKSLKDPSEKANRSNMLFENHIAPLTKFVYLIRTEKGDQYSIPFFDPLDGGINAKILFLLEAPGPNAVKSGFISRNNPDETAKNMFQILEDVGIPRNETILWNIVPWYIGNIEKIRPANTKDITQGWYYLKRLIQLLPYVDTIVLVGRKSQKIKKQIVKEYTNLKIIECFHPSPMFINHDINNRNKLTEQLMVLKK
jgi:uracil-DNA glycosylase